MRSVLRPLGSAYGQSDIVLVPEHPLDIERLVERVKHLFDLQKIVIIVCGEGVVDEQGRGGGMDFSYYFPWKYLGVRFQGAGFSLSSGDFTVTETLNGVRQVSRTGSVSTSAGVITTDLIVRLPLDDFWSGVHLAPYAMGGFGAIFGGGGGATINTRFPELNSRVNSVTEGIRSRVLGNIGGGFEYRFTPNWAIFGEAGYNIVNGPNNNFVQANFGFRYAFGSW